MQNNKSTKPPNPHTLLILQTPETRSHVDNNLVGKNFKLMSELYQPKKNWNPGSYIQPRIIKKLIAAHIYNKDSTKTQLHNHTA